MKYKITTKSGYTYYTDGDLPAINHDIEKNKFNAVYDDNNNICLLNSDCIEVITPCKVPVNIKISFEPIIKTDKGKIY